MTIWAIVPVKPLRLGKSRLAGVLSDQERAILNRLFLENTLDILRRIPEIGQTLVVSRDPAALAVAREFDARTVLEDGSPDLNGALTRATILARNFARRGVLVIPADIPLLSPDDLRGMFCCMDRSPCVVISPDRHKDGTNALMLSPGGIIPYKYGPGSFQRHCDLARKANANLEIVYNHNLALDLDTPADLNLLQSFERFKMLTS